MDKRDACPICHNNLGREAFQQDVRRGRHVNTVTCSVCKSIFRITRYSDGTEDWMRFTEVPQAQKESAHEHD